MLSRCNQRKTGDDAFARRKTGGLGAGDGRGGAIAGRRRRTQRLSDGSARRLRVRLHEDQRGDAAGVGEVLVLHRRDRIDPALRSLCRGRNLLEPFTGAWPVWNHVPVARTGKSSDQRSQARAGRRRGALLLSLALGGMAAACNVRPPATERRQGSALGPRRSRARTRPSVRALSPLLQTGDGLPPAGGSGQPKASASGQGEAFASGQKPPSSTRRQKRQRRSPSRQIYFTAWVACAREMMAPTFLVAIDQCGE